MGIARIDATNLNARVCKPTLLLEPLPDRVLPASLLSLLLLFADAPLLAVTTNGLRCLHATKYVLQFGILPNPPALMARSGCRVHCGLHLECGMPAILPTENLGIAADATRRHCMGSSVVVWRQTMAACLWGLHPAPHPPADLSTWTDFDLLISC